ncbi:MAG: tRNA pseudouridine(55) synthase TruB [Coriobacteriia bacterium]|nr:tRNA pseudouridine(55) synthase TruB [Coriobacteriia bacterium]
MAKKRGASGLSLVVGVDKPVGCSSHDVVNACRRIFGERRVGHTGTLDPAASGALLVCVGPAARLDAHFANDSKEYLARIALGASTDTDDAQGQVTMTFPVPEKATDPDFAQRVLDGFTGTLQQLPPVYSALKVNGQKACDQARKGNVIDLAPRTVEVSQAKLLRITSGGGAACYEAEGAPGGLQSWQPGPGVASTCEGLPTWDVLFSVSKGTYIRSLARDIGLSVGCGAHVCALRRTRAGRLDVRECVSLETLEQVGTAAALDPLRLLGMRFAYVDGEAAVRVSHGNALPAEALVLCERRFEGLDAALCACTSGVRESCDAPRAGETVALLCCNKLVALYAYDAQRERYVSVCVFSEGVIRGTGL